MSSDRKQFRRALRKFEELKSERRFSMSPEIGVIAIMYSLCSDKPGEQDIEYFEAEAHDLQRKAQQVGRSAIVVRGVNQESLGGVMNEPCISDVIMIGHGNFSSVFTDDDGRADWLDISKMASHLKLGQFTQRFCGNYMRELSVPFSLFAVHDPWKIYAASGLTFAPEDDPEHELLIRPINTRDIYDYDAIKANHPAQEWDDD